MGSNSATRRLERSRMSCAPREAVSCCCSSATRRRFVPGPGPLDFVAARRVEPPLRTHHDAPPVRRRPPGPAAAAARHAPTPAARAADALARPPSCCLAALGQTAPAWGGPRTTGAVSACAPASSGHGAPGSMAEAATPGGPAVAHLLEPPGAETA